MSPGVPAISVVGMAGEIFDRSTNGAAIALPMLWRQPSVAPQFGSAVNVTSATNSPTLLNNPVSLPGVTNQFAATTSAGHVEFFNQTVTGATAWSATDVTALDASPVSAGQIAAAANGSQIFLASLGASGHVLLYSITAANAAKSPAKTPVNVTPGTVPRVAKLSPLWSYQDLTAAVAGAPVWEGNIFIGATATSVNVAGRAANWGDLYNYSTSLPNLSWTSTDVSLDAGASEAATSQVSGLVEGSTTELYVTSSGTVTPHGVGVYAIPSADWSRAISDGWPIISETGGLGTFNAPWVGFTNAPSVTQSPDFLMGQSILNSKKRETWLSFWTVSGPTTPATQTTASYYSHGFLAGQWVAQQIDQYRLHGVPIKPNWVILDPEGYPDNHSALDAPAGSSAATMAKYAGYWSAMLQGWSVGISDVDPTLRPGVYASQSEYRNYGLTNLSMPVFQAIAFGGGGPLRIPGSNGHNILGYIAFNGTCSPTSTLRSQEQTLLNAPWAGQYNTLQFNSGVYCAP
jgi:hypothetical protein